MINIPETVQLGKRGTVVIPARLRQQFDLTDGSLLIAEARDGGVFLRPAQALPLEIYSDMRIAEFRLNNAVDADDYAAARADVAAMGLDPAAIPHQPVK